MGGAENKGKMAAVLGDWVEEEQKSDGWFAGDPEGNQREWRRREDP